MDIKIHNTLSGKKEIFKPIKKGQISMYQCGPTVYDTAHIGNLRTYVFNDIVRRVFEYNDYKVNQAMNFTDIDDKTIRRSIAESIPLSELTQKYEGLFLDNLSSLNILKPVILMRATDYISSMVKMIEDLIQKDFAYIAKDGVYMNIAKVKDYGRLAKLKIEENSQAKERIKNDEYDKENVRDFALWKFWTEGDGQNVWDPKDFGGSFDKGRPGWHIECSAMSIEALGKTIDIHTGGSDLVFPHHTNEIAQSECFSGQNFVNYWIHGGFMNINDEKMAKSKGNFLKLSDLSDNGISPIGFRYWLLNAHYRTQINFKTESVLSSQIGQKNFVMTLTRLINEMAGKSGNINQDYKNKFLEQINDDFNIPGGLALAWTLIKDDNIPALDRVATILDFDRVFGLNLNLALEINKEDLTIPEEIIALVEAREDARKNKNWSMADSIRKEIENRGFSVKDTDNGPQITNSSCQDGNHNH